MRPIVVTGLIDSRERQVMDHFFDRRAAFPADEFWFVRPQVRAQRADVPAAEPTRDDSLNVFARDWTDTSVQLGAVRWYAR